MLIDVTKRSSSGRNIAKAPRNRNIAVQLNAVATSPDLSQNKHVAIFH